MANVAAVHVRIFSGGRIRKTGGRWPAISHVAILEALLETNSGYSYAIPLSFAYANEGGFFDISYGAKWTPYPGIETLWERREEADIAALWVRWHDSGADHDVIYSYDERGQSEHRPCRYAFDAIETDDGARIAVSGTYLTANGEYSGRVDDLPPGIEARVAELKASAREIRWLAKGRVVHTMTRYGERWGDRASDTWANCADEDYLESVQLTLFAGDAS